MSFSCGIVGLPNVGKSTLFNAITNNNVEASNYPFCTIEPNHGVVAVPDPRLDRLTQLFSSQKTIHATVEFTDIAGLVKGASQGEGLGNQFLANIRTCDAIIQVVRVFEDENITRDGKLDPLGDLEVINTELILADLQTIENKIEAIKKKIRANRDKEAVKAQEIYERLKAHLETGGLARQLEFSEDEYVLAVRDCHLLTQKPMMVVANVSEAEVNSYDSNALYQTLKKHLDSENIQVLCLSAKIEGEISQLEPEERPEFMEMAGLSESGLDRLIVTGYKLLELQTFFTAGEKETRAWTVRRGATAPQAAGVIHTDFEKGFIKAEIGSFEDIDRLETMNKVREEGKLRMEGKAYIMQDGDVCHFRFNN